MRKLLAPLENKIAMVKFFVKASEFIVNVDFVTLKSREVVTCEVSTFKVYVNILLINSLY